MNTLTSLISLIAMIVVVYSVFLKKKNINTTDCHPKTDNFDFWCLKELGKGWLSNKIIDGNCDKELKKSTCKRSN